MKLLGPFEQTAPYLVVLHFAGYIDGHWTMRTAILGRCETFEEAFFFTLNVPGTQDFYKSGIVFKSEEIRAYAQNCSWRNKGFVSPDEANRY